MYHLYAVPLSIAAIIVYTIMRTKYKMNIVRIVQPLMSFIVILVAALSFLQENVQPSYTIWILAALGTAFITDIFHIDMRKNNVLLIGIIGFSIAYSIYPVAFSVLNGFHVYDFITAVPLLAVYIFTLFFFIPRIGALKIPGIIYLLVCPLMVHRAISTFFGTYFTTIQSVMVTSGAILVYVGDLEYGVHRFVKERKFLFGHICYGTGQLLMAMSCSYF